MRECQCACGGTLRADERNPEAVPVAVSIHNLTPQHQDWRNRGGMEQPDLPPIPVHPGWTWLQAFDAYERRRIS